MQNVFNYKIAKSILADVEENSEITGLANARKIYKSMSLDCSSVKETSILQCICYQDWEMSVGSFRPEGPSTENQCK